MQIKVHALSLRITLACWNADREVEGAFFFVLFCLFVFTALTVGNQQQSIPELAPLTHIWDKQ